MGKTNTALVEYAKAQLGRPYWLGTYGQTANASLYAAKKKQLPGYYTASDFPSQYGKRVHDCVGLIKGYIWSDGPDSPPVYASNGCPDINEAQMYVNSKEKGAISTMPDIPGILVFLSGHVGVYIGNGEVIEARGHAYGVVKTKLAGRGWTTWAKCPYITYETGKEQDNMTGEEIYTKLQSYLNEQPVPEWARGELLEAINMGITDGSDPMALIPRYQAAIMAKRALEKDNALSEREVSDR